MRGQHVVAVAGLIVRHDFSGQSSLARLDSSLARPRARFDVAAPRVLALRRAASNLAGPGLWETVSGRIEQGEEPLAAVQREIVEESGLTVAVEDRPFATYAAQRRGQPMIVILFRARYLAGEVTLSAEHDAFAWLAADEFRARSTLLPLVTVVEQALTLPLL